MLQREVGSGLQTNSKLLSEPEAEGYACNEGREPDILRTFHTNLPCFLTLQPWRSVLALGWTESGVWTPCLPVFSLLHPLPGKGKEQAFHFLSLLPELTCLWLTYLSEWKVDKMS